MSNLIKSNRYIPLEDIRKVEPPPLWSDRSIENDTQVKTEEPSEQQREAEAKAEQLLQDAKEAADEILRSASEEAERIKQTASADIEKWWEERRALDLNVVEDSRKSGFDTGYREGFEQAEKEVAQTYDALIKEAQELVEEAYKVKDRVIAESEPFLVELSIAIARKIIGDYLAAQPDWLVGQVKQLISGRREKGIITICVAPSQFSMMQDSRNELVLSLDSQAELAIVPDASVDVGGCIIRTDFGSIDARIDTQLSEIKAALTDLATQGDEAE